jgi:hypothetical protein
MGLPEMGMDMGMAMGAPMGAPPPPQASVQASSQPRMAKMRSDGGGVNGMNGVNGKSFLNDMKNIESADTPSRMLIKDGDIAYTTPSTGAGADASFDDLVNRIKSIVAGTKDGYIDSSNVDSWQHTAWDFALSKNVHAQLRRTNLSVKVPSDHFDGAMLSLQQLGSSKSGVNDIIVTRQSSNSRDVTSQYIDSQSRVAVLKATENALTKLLESSGTTREILDVQKELTRVINEKEGNVRQIKYLEGASSMSSIRIYVEERPKEWAPKPVKKDDTPRIVKTFKKAVDSIGMFMGVVVDSCVYAAVWAVPSSIILVLVKKVAVKESSGSIV